MKDNYTTRELEIIKMFPNYEIFGRQDLETLTTFAVYDIVGDHPEYSEEEIIKTFKKKFLK